MRANIELRNVDCMEYLHSCEDNAFDLAIVDPPYGIEKAANATSRVAKYGQVETVNDYKPTAEYFYELFRVSKNQIVWGYNHLSDLLPPTKEYVFWFKHQPVTTYSDGELAWTSFTKTAKCFDHPYFGSHNRDKERIHPTQKPVKLYEWLLDNYAKEGDRILDTHLGSGSIALACWNRRFDLVGCEFDPDYFAAATKRLNKHKQQLQMF